MDGFFAPPPMITGLLGEQEAERLRKQSIGTGLVGALIGGLTAAPLYRTQGIAPILGQALSAGMQGSQNVYSNALEGYMTQQKIAEMQRQQAQQKMRDELIANLSPEEQALARIDPSSFGEIQKARLGIGRKTFTPLTPQMREDYVTRGIKLDPRKNYQVDNTTGALSEVGGTGELAPPTVGLSDFSIIRALQPYGWSSNPNDWTPGQARTFKRITEAPNPAEAARITLDAQRTAFETGKGVAVPQTMEQIFADFNVQPQPAAPTAGARTPSAPTVGGVPSAAPSVTTMAANVPPAPVQPRQAQPKAAEQPRQPSVFEQSTPKVRQELLLQRPQVAQSLANMNFKFDSIISQTDGLLKNTKGLKAVTGLSSKFPNIRGEARDAQATLDYLKSRAATEALQAMRDASKTGGAIGQVTEKEWPRLESAFGSLAESQTYEQFNANLRNLKRAMQEFQKNVRSSFFDTYGTDAQAGKEPMTPASQGQVNWMPGVKNVFEKYR
jgi:hypothetical protein